MRARPEDEASEGREEAPGSSEPAPREASLERVGTVEAGVAGERDSGSEGLPVVGRRRYAVENEQGRGGVGRVLVAHDHRLRRTVALKELLPTRANTRRFEREVFLTARLQHPNIVPIYDAGRDEGGHPFYTMRFVEGVSLADAVAYAPSLRSRLLLVPRIVAVAEAMAYAHEQGVVHRDLTPENVMLGRFGETLVIDWGLAKDLAAGDEEAPELPSRPESVGDGTRTVPGTVLGTPVFMPPEQAAGLPTDTRSDVYAIGTLLYYVLSGTTPFRGIEGRHVLRQVAAGAFVPLDVRTPEVPDELVAIVHRAMARRPEDRYRTADALAHDLQRFQAGQLVRAYEYSWAERVARLARRHRAVLATAGVALAVLLVGAAWGVQRVVGERDAARAARDVAQQERAVAEARSRELVLQQARASLATDPTAAVAWLATLAPGAGDEATVRSIATRAAMQGVARHVLVGHASPVETLGFTPDGSRLLTGDNFRELRVWSTTAGRLDRLIDHGGPVDDFVVVSDTKVVSLGQDGRLRLVGLEDGSVTLLEDVGEGPVGGMALADGGRTLATVHGSGALVVRDLQTRAARVLARLDGGGDEVAVSPDGGVIAAAADDRVTVLVDRAGRALARWQVHVEEVDRMAFSPDGRFVATAGRDPFVGLYDVAARRARVLEGHAGYMGDIAWLPNEGVLVSANRDRTIRLWDAASGETLHMLLGHEDDIERLAVSPSGRLVASTSVDATVRVWDLWTGEVRVLLGHGSMTKRVAFSPDGGTLVSTASSPAVRVWDAAPSPARTLSGHGNDVNAVVFSSDASRLATAGQDDSVRLFDLEGVGEGRVWTTTPHALLTVHEEPVHALAVTADDRRLLAGGWDGKVSLWDPTSGALRVFEGHRHRIDAVALGPDDRWAVSASRDHTLRVWNLDTGDSRVLEGHEGPVRALDLDPAGQVLGSAGGKTVRLWSVPDGRPLRVLSGHADTPHLVVFGPEGRRLASAGRDDVVRVWDAATGASLLVLEGHEAQLRGLDFSPGGDLVASCGNDQTTRLWDLRDGTARILGGHDDYVRGCRFSPDGAMLATTGSDGTLLLWNTEPGTLLLRRSTGAYGQSLTFSPDGETVAVGSWDKKVHLIPVDGPQRLPPDRPGLRRWLEGLTTARLRDDSRPESPRAD